MMLVVMGPDGCGKSSAIDGITQALSSCFKTIQYQHLMPSLRNSSVSRPVDDPHGKPAYGLTLSLLKLAYLFFVYTLGAVRCRGIIRSPQSLLIFDRYYQDILIDPRRFRYGGPQWLLRAIGRMIPSPNLFILLDASPEVLQARKQEVPFPETSRQRAAYLELTKGLANAHVVDASAPLEEVIAVVSQLVRMYQNGAGGNDAER